MTSRIAKGKLFCPDRATLENILKQAAEAWGSEATISPVMWSRDGDYFAFINWFGVGSEVRGWRDLSPSTEQKKVLFDLGIKIPATRGEATDLLNKVLNKGRQGP
jgi:hypothetical protein